MRNYKTIGLTAVLGSLVLVGCATWQKGEGDRTAGRVVDDKKITVKVESGLANETVYKFNDIDVRTYQGVVQLSGFVKSEEQKQRAGQIAQNVPGVARVVNSIVVQNTDNLTPTGRQSGTAAPITNTSTNRVDQ